MKKIRSFKVLRMSEKAREKAWEKGLGWMRCLVGREHALNLSPENFEYCQNLYNKNPDDIDNLLRILTFKLLLGRDCADLTKRFIKLWQGGKTSPAYLGELNLEIELNDEQRNKLRDFLIWVFQVDSEKFRKEITDELEIFMILSPIVGHEVLSPHVDAYKVIRRPIQDGVGDWDYETRYLLGRGYFMHQKWFEAYLMFETVDIFNYMYGATDEMVANLGKYSSHDKILDKITVEGIKDFAHSCLYGAFHGDVIAESVKASVSRLIISQNMLYDQMLLTKKKYERTRDFDKICKLESSFRRFISQSLYRFYKTKKRAWTDGVPERIRIKCTERWEEAKREGSEYDYLDFSDYEMIIKEKRNWEGVFKKYFFLKRLDKQKSSSDMVSFIGRLSSIRHILAHNRRKLSAEEIASLNNSYNHFMGIYSEWEKTKGAAINKGQG